MKEISVKLQKMVITLSGTPMQYQSFPWKYSLLSILENELNENEKELHLTLWERTSWYESLLKLSGQFIIFSKYFSRSK